MCKTRDVMTAGRWVHGSGTVKRGQVVLVGAARTKVHAGVVAGHVGSGERISTIRTHKRHTCPTQNISQI